MSIFQEAFLKKNQEMVDCIREVAKKNKFELAVEWMLPHGKTDNLLQAALHRNLTNDVNNALALVCSSLVPFNAAASVMKAAFPDILLKHPEIMETALADNDFVREACQLRLHIGFLNQKLRQDTAVHIMTSDTFLEWNCVVDPDCIERNFRDQNATTVESMESHNDVSTTTASLRYVAIENAAKIGMNGILRPLLMYKAAAHVFKTPAVKLVILYKWFKIWKKRFIKSAMFYSSFLVCFVIYAVLTASSSEISEQNVRRKTVSLLFLAGNVGFAVRMLIEEIRPIKVYQEDGQKLLGKRIWGLCYFLSSRWNILDMISCFLLLVVIPISHGVALSRSGYDDWLSAIVAAEAILASVKVHTFQ